MYLLLAAPYNSKYLNEYGRHKGISDVKLYLLDTDLIFTVSWREHCFHSCSSVMCEIIHQVMFIILFLSYLHYFRVHI
jgi:hypothetical protein